MWRLSKALKVARLGALNRSSLSLWNSARHESSTSKDSDVKAEVPYKTLQVINAMRSFRIYRYLLPSLNNCFKHIFMTCNWRSRTK